jgi:hypothetical protein
MSGDSELTVSLPVEALAQAIAQRVAVLVADAETSPWLNKTEAIEYSRIPVGTFEKLSAAGTIPSHGGKTKVYNRIELDNALKAL